ncbi:MAG: hypothetical protein K8S20_09045 [Chloroflexi bacterium]|nr:hypothetical protein [Chloroflexota bacterium]
MKKPDSNLNFPPKFVEHLLACVFIFLAALIVLDQANPSTTHLGRDSGNFLYIARTLLRGKTLYLFAWENKPPGIFFIDALGLWLGRGTRWGIFIMEFAFLLTAATAGFHLLKNRFGVGIATASTLIWLVGLNFVLNGGNFTEEYSLAFNFLSLCLLPAIVNGRKPFLASFLLGILLGCSFFMRANNTGVQISIILTLIILHWVEKDRTIPLNLLIAIGFGFLLPAGGVLYYFIARDAVRTFIDASFIYNFFYSSGHFQPLGALFSGLKNLSFVGGVTMVGLWVSLEELWLQLKNRRMDPFLLWLCINFIVDVALSGLSGRNYEHYFINWLPMVAMSSAYLMKKGAASSNEWTRKFPVRSLLAAITIIIILCREPLLNSIHTISQISIHHSLFQKPDPISEYVNSHSLPGQTVLVWGGQTGINFLANRDAPTRYVFYPYYVESEYTDQISAEFYQAVNSHPPALIVDGSYFVPEEVVPLSTASPIKWLKEHQAYNPPYLEEFYAFFRSHYSYETTVNRVDIYRLDK